MSIRIRLVLIVLIGFAVLLSLLYAAIRVQHQLHAEYDEIYIASAELIQDAEQTQINLYRQLLAWSNLQLRGRNPGEYYHYLQAFYEQERITRSKIHVLQDRLKSFAIPPEVTQDFVDSYFELARQYRFALKIFNHSDNPVSETDKYLSPYVDSALRNFSRLESIFEQQRDRLLTQTEEKVGPAQFFFAIIIITNMVVFLLVFLWWIDRNIGKPLLTSINSAKKIADGDVSQRFSEGMPGEFSVYAEAFNQMMDNLEEANADLHARMNELKSEIERREALEMQLQEKKLVAEQAARAKTEFLSTMSHEIRTPLNIVIGYSDLLAETQLDEQQHRYINSINNGADSLLAIIDDVLDLAKIEAGKLNVNKEVFNLHDMLQGIEDMFRQQAAGKGLQFLVKRTEDVPDTVTTDPHRVKQILLNLLSNALKFTEDGSIELSVWAVMKPNGCADLMFSVTDTGIGIADDYQQRVFNRFEQQDGQDTRRFGGTGLGLAISQRLAVMLGGELRLVSSEVGKGACFEFKLYNVPVDAAVAIPSPADSSRTLDLRPATLLVVDDFAANRSLIKDLLADQPVEIVEAENGQQALDMARELMPDLILMDLKMPEMDGVTATRIIKADSELKHIPIMALTASAIQAGEENIKQALFDEYLVKPLDIGKLFVALERYLS